MTPEQKKDLLFAILAIDSYNRGYEAGISGLGGEGSRIGEATLGKDAEQLLAQGAAEDAGFYASAYDTPDGLVISYRGTDGAVDSGSDLIWGWAVGGDFLVLDQNNNGKIDAANENGLTSVREAA